MKNISLYKFLLPLSVAMLVTGAIILLLGYLPNSNLSSNIGLICGGFLFFGFIFFIISLIDSSISRKRAIITGEETSIVLKSHSILKYIGIAVIVIIIIFFATLFYLVSTTTF